MVIEILFAAGGILQLIGAVVGYRTLKRIEDHQLKTAECCSDIAKGCIAMVERLPVRKPRGSKTAPASE